MEVYAAADVHDRLPWPWLVQALEQAYSSDRQAAHVPQRHVHALSQGDSLLLMPAWDEALIVTKIVSVMPGAPHTVQAMLLVQDRATGVPLACIDGEAITLRRTAGASAMAARRMARADACTLLLVGTGRLAPWMARAHWALRPGLQKVLVWGRDADAAQALAQQLAREGLPAVAAPADDLPAAAHSADIVCCATTARSPVVQGDWLRPGTHLDLVGAFRPDMREVDDTAVLRSAIVVDGPAALAEGGDLVQLLASGRLTPDAIAGDLWSLLGTTALQHRGTLDLTLYKSVGSAFQDLVAARAVLARNGS